MYTDEATRARALEQIAHYNELSEAGAGTDYGKAASAMIPFNEGPYYGMTASFGPGSATPMMVTMSGMETDEQLRVIDHEGNPIKGLYMVSNTLGGRCGTGHATPCAGNSIAFPHAKTTKNSSITRLCR